MRKTKLFTIITMLLISLFSLFFMYGCEKDELTEITLGTYKAEMNVGDKQTLTYSLNKGTAEIEFIPSDKTIVSISDDGVLEALKAGEVNIEVIITASDDTKKTFNVSIKVFILKHNIEYILDGGVINSEAPKEIEENTSLDLLVPEKEGYTFLGWTLIENSTEYITRLTDVTTDIKLYAHYEEKSFIITKSINGIETKISVSYNNDITLDAVSLEGYKFLGWSLEENGKQYISEIKHIKESQIVYAVFEKLSYTITFVIPLELVSGEVNETQKCFYGDEVILPELSVVSGYIFAGWSNNPSDDTVISKLDNVKKDYTLYAVINKNISTITMINDDESIEKVIDNGSSYALEPLSREGYTFLGWTIDKDNPIYITELTSIQSDITVYAIFEVTKYSVTLIDKEEITKQYNYGENIVLDVYEKEGYYFIGWSKSLEDTTNPITVIDNIKEDYILYAIYEEILYTITYITNDTTTRKSYRQGESIALPLEEKTGYTFLGWTLEEDAKDYLTIIEELTEDITLYANFNIITYKITYILNGGTFKNNPVTEYTVKDILVFEIPTMMENNFLNWELESGTYVTSTEGLTKDITLHALWEKKVLTVGEGMTYLTLTEAITSANDNDIIVCYPGTYEGATINKSVKVKGANAGINPNISIRKDETVFTSDLIIAANDVTIDGIALIGNGKIITDVTKSISNLSISCVKVYDSTVNPSSEYSYLAPFTFASGKGLLVKNVTLTNSRIEKISTGRPMIIYGTQVEDITIKNNVFLGGYHNYNDGIKFDNTTDFGLRGNVNITGNTFEDYAQYVLWFRTFGAGNYVIENNTFTKVGQNVDTHAMANFIKSSVSESEKIAISIKYNKITNGQILLRFDNDGTALGTNATINVNYNILVNPGANYYIKSLTPASINADYNYFGVSTPNTTKFTGTVTYNNSYTDETSVPTVSAEKKYYNITYDLNGGSWPAKEYTYEEIVTDLLNDFTKWYGTSATKENIHTISENAKVTIPGFFSSEEYGTKWQWLRTYLMYCRENDLERSSTYSYLVENNNQYWRYEIAGFVNRVKWASWPYSSDYTRIEYLEKFQDDAPKGDVFDYPTKYLFGVDTILVSPVLKAFNFEGWEDINGNLLTYIPFNFEGDISLRAIWKPAVVPTAFEVTNIPEEGIIRYEELSLKYTFTPENTYDKQVYFKSSDESIFTVDKYGLITAVGYGEATLSVIVSANSTLNKEYKIMVYAPGYVEVSYNTVPFVSVNQTIKIDAEIAGLASGTLEWISKDPLIATVDENGVITGIGEGYTIIDVRIKGTEIHTEVGVTVFNNFNELDDVVKAILETMNANSLSTMAVSYNDNNYAYSYPIYRGANQYLFEDLNVNTEFMRNDRDDLSTPVAYICIHDTGNFSTTAGAKANIQYFQTASTSIHYTVGNDGVFQGVPLDDRAAHAGDGVRPYALDKTNVLVTDKAPVITMIDGYFAINGEKTNLRPYDANGIPVTTNYTTKQITYSGIRCVAGDDGYYYLGKTYFNTTYQKISNYGGNASSIGIESCVNSGTDYYLTMQRTAKLTAMLMKKFDLTIDDVKMHNFFSGKNCAQLMKNNSRFELAYLVDGYEYEDTLWGEFLELVQVEYKMLDYSLYTFNFISSNTDLLDNNGRIVGHNTTPTCVSYTLDITSDKGDTITIKSSIIIPGTYSFK